MTPGPELTADILAELEGLRDAFRADAAALVDALAADWARVVRDPSVAGLRELVRQAHSLAGTAGSFALPELSRRARALEDALDRVAIDDVASDLAKAEPLLRTLREEAGPADAAGAPVSA